MNKYELEIIAMKLFHNFRCHPAKSKEQKMKERTKLFPLRTLNGQESKNASVIISSFCK